MLYPLFYGAIMGFCIRIIDASYYKPERWLKWWIDFELFHIIYVKKEHQGQRNHRGGKACDLTQADEEKVREIICRDPSILKN